MMLKSTVTLHHITAILLADGWHGAEHFELVREHEFADADDDGLAAGDERVLHTGGPGFFFWDGEKRISGPLTSLLAVEEQLG